MFLSLLNVNENSLRGGVGGVKPVSGSRDPGSGFGAGRGFSQSGLWGRGVGVLFLAHPQGDRPWRVSCLFCVMNVCEGFIKHYALGSSFSQIKFTETGSVN